MDYNPEHSILGLCGNFSDIRLINSDMDNLVEESKKYKQSCE
jgi:hypothetical protein